MSDRGGNRSGSAGPVGDEPGAGDPVVVDLSRGERTDQGPVGGAVWSLPHGGDLDANLVRLQPGQRIGTHVNDDVDVLIFVRDGTGELTLDGSVHPLGAEVLALVPRGTARSIAAGSTGLDYLSTHRRRSPLTISGSGSGPAAGQD